MFEHLKQRWGELLYGRPGKRFQEYYLRRHSTGRGRLRKLLVMAAGAVAFAAGIFLLAAPGPGFLLLLVGASMMAEESALAARALDMMELRIHRLAERVVRAWTHSPAFKRLVLLLSAVTAGVAGWAAYNLILEL
jgi:hypothetical protein